MFTQAGRLWAIWSVGNSMTAIKKIHALYTAGVFLLYLMEVFYRSYQRVIGCVFDAENVSDTRQ